MGGRESQRLIVPSKRGNQTEGPRRGKEMPSHEPLKGNMPGTLRHELCSHNKDGSRGSRIHEMRNRVRVMCKPGSEGGRGGQPRRSTRPNGCNGWIRCVASVRYADECVSRATDISGRSVHLTAQATWRDCWLSGPLPSGRRVAAVAARGAGLSGRTRHGRDQGWRVSGPGN